MQPKICQYHQPTPPQALECDLGKSADQTQLLQNLLTKGIPKKALLTLMYNDVHGFRELGMARVKCAETVQPFDHGMVGGSKVYASHDDREYLDLIGIFHLSLADHGEFRLHDEV